ncbi:60S ribosomal protein L17 (nucleomorph) [Chroomonas mesostigmatica CCMP1168]|uniref:60S ribosomal protein L17 n=1 Tax=Chroomonas mesostigmatica CCMP1168 TaxID=1195612 RepID=J7G3J9_9CRYP|nr:60S ribosomal protein L17 [Chroomonas mesostigmatica CCMP1168]|mmetsp:Transcript_58827/g.144230  ORF Transcript_58827/g.144230 Transcript_58827/m.144230 type:complete len:162 (-) Transcript_58827:283-768(-)
MRTQSHLSSNNEKQCVAVGRDLKVHFKNTRETAAALKGMSLSRAKKFLENVCCQKEIVPFVRYRYGIGRKAQLKNSKSTSGRWPKKSAQNILRILKNAEASAKEKDLNPLSLYIQNIQVNKAMKGHRRTFRAHGRITPFLSHPCHINLWLVEKKSNIPRNF